jgi:hypothetical protein
VEEAVKYRVHTVNGGVEEVEGRSLQIGGSERDLLLLREEAQFYGFVGPVVKTWPLVSVISWWKVPE